MLVGTPKRLGTRIYTAHQLCGVTPPVRPFFLAAGVNLCYFHQSAPGNFQKSPALISSFLRSANFSSFSKRQSVSCVSNTFSCVLSLQLQFQKKVAIMPVNFPPGILELIVLLFGRGLSQMAISRNTRVSQGGISNYLRHVQETRRAIQRPHGASAENDHTKGRPCPCPNNEQKRISLIVENQGRADQANWTSIQL